MVRKASAVLCSTDLDRSREFYEQKVGLPAVAGDDPEPPAVRVRRRHDAARLRTPLAQHGRPHAGAVLVGRRRADVAELRERGVVFEEYDFPTLKTVDGSRRRPASARRPGSRTPTATRSRCFSPSSQDRRQKCAISGAKRHSEQESASSYQRRTL